MTLGPAALAPHSMEEDHGALLWAQFHFSRFSVRFWAWLPRSLLLTVSDINGV